MNKFLNGMDDHIAKNKNKETIKRKKQSTLYISINSNKYWRYSYKSMLQNQLCDHENIGIIDLSLISLMQHMQVILVNFFLFIDVIRMFSC